MRLNNKALAVGVAVLLAGSAAAQERGEPATDGPPPANGPNATSDRSPDRYDQGGYAVLSAPAADPQAFTAANRNLPLGAFAEVTSLDSGKTILVMIAGQAPADSLIGLSPAAATALGRNGRSTVRVRRVTPTPADQNALKNGQQASGRMDAPAALLAGLRARLSGPPPIATAPPVAVAPKTPIKPPRASPQPTKTSPSAVTTPTPAVGDYYVQVAAFSSKDRAAALAKSLGGTASPFKSLWRVRTGPFADAKKAAQARDAAAARGYGDARVVRQD